MRRTLAPIAALAFASACNGGSDAPDETGPGTGPGSTVASEDVLSASCALTDQNELRVWCDATLASSGTAQLELSAPGVPTWTFDAEAAGTEIEIFGWGLKADTTYTWKIGAQTGTITTGSLPSNLANAEITVTGTSFGFDAILQPLNCTDRYFVIIDGDGDIIWYQQNDLYVMGMDGYEWSQDDRSILIANDGQFEEISVQGPTILELDSGDFTGMLHHDVARWGPYTYLLHDYSYNGKTVDGVHVFEGTTLKGTFHLEDWFDTSIGGGGGMENEWSHANGVNPTADGHIVMSLLIWDTVLSFDGDPTSPTFLDLDWHASGSNSGLAGADYTAPAGTYEGFDGQHNASLHADGLWLFDNQGGPDGSRAAHYTLDDASGEVRWVESWDVGDTCTIEGGAVPVDGGVLASCATSGQISEFETGASVPSFTLHATCGGGGGPGGGDAMNRGIPVWVR